MAVQSSSLLRALLERDARAAAAALPTLGEAAGGELRAESVRRKRKHKMNKHKHKRRLRLMRNQSKR